MLCGSRLPYSKAGGMAESQPDDEVIFKHNAKIINSENKKWRESLNELNHTATQEGQLTGCNRFQTDDSDNLWEELKTTSNSIPIQSDLPPEKESTVMDFLNKRQKEMQLGSLPVFDLFSSPGQTNSETQVSSVSSDDAFKDFAPIKGSETFHSKGSSLKAKTHLNKENHSSPPYPPCHNIGSNENNCSKSSIKNLPCGSSSGKKYPWQILKSQSEAKAIPQHPAFRTASLQLAINNQKKHGSANSSPNAPSVSSYGTAMLKRSLGARTRGPGSKFVPPVKQDDDDLLSNESSTHLHSFHRANSFEGNIPDSTNKGGPFEELMADEKLKNIEPKMVELIMNEILDSGPSVEWDDIAGLKLAKNTIQEIVVWPLLRPDIFVGLRGPSKGILLFGPPGTGKTMIGKCIASQSQSTFFSISASSLTSKWVGEGEKMVRALFAVARCHQPAVIFIDEIDSLLTQRSESEHESSRRIKTEFLVQLDGATSGSEERLLVVGATNRPQELDEAARRRLVKRLYIPLPDSEARAQIVKNLLLDQNHTLNSKEIDSICQKTSGYSGADMANLCREAALGPIRNLSFSDIKNISVDEVRPIAIRDFESALHCIRASVSDEDLHLYEDWNRKFGITPAPPSDS